MCEAVYLGKPMLAMPLAHQFEQLMNAPPPAPDAVWSGGVPDLAPLVDATDTSRSA
jgi:hypothetical protein